MTDETKDTQPLLKDILEEMRAGFARIDERLTAIEARLAHIERRLDRLEERFDFFLEDLVELRKRMRKIDQPIQ